MAMNNNDIPRVADVPSYVDFLESYLKPNIPVIIGSALVKDWPALHLWTCEAEDGSRTINWAYLAEHYGQCEVSVADCSISDAFGNLECETAFIRDVVAKWQEGRGHDLYVKDWHLPRTVEPYKSSASLSSEYTSPAAFYTTPDIFRDDWMNSYYTTFTPDDFRFVYCGAKGTFTPLHRDVYCSYSWSTNVCGRKRWWMYPPEDTKYLFMKERRIAAHDVRCVDESKFPDFKKAKPLVVIQEAGETIFVPSGWYHQVENLTACISINHNWCNSVNLPQLYRSMCDEIEEVEKALDDVRDMLKASQSHEEDWRKEFTKVVQDVVQQDAGWNWLTFWRMVMYALSSAIVSDRVDIPELSCMSLAPHTGNPMQPIFTPACAKLRPPLTLVLFNVKACYEDFITRTRYEDEGEVGTLVHKVQSVIRAVNAQAS